MLTKYFTRGINTQKYSHVFKKDVFSPILVVCLFRDLTKCLRLCARPEEVQPKRQNKKKEVVEYMRTHATRIELCVTSCL